MRMLEKIMHKGDEYYPDFDKEYVGKNIIVPINVPTDHLEVDNRTSKFTVGQQIFNYDTNKFTIRRVIGYRGIPFAFFDFDGDETNMSIPDVIKNGGVFNSLLTHIKQAFRVSLLKRGALNA